MKYVITYAVKKVILKTINLLENTKYNKIQQNTTKYNKIQQNTTKYKRKNSKRCQFFCKKYKKFINPSINKIQSLGVLLILHI